MMAHDVQDKKDLISQMYIGFFKFFHFSLFPISTV